MERLKIGELVLGEGLCREKIKCASIRLLVQGGKYWQIIGKSLSTGRAGRKDNVLPGPGMSPCFKLMRVEAVDPGCDQRLFDGSRQILREGMRLCGTGR